MVLKTGFEAMKSGDSVDYQRFYQQQSDVCMLRLFDSFAESAPQLVFHLYVMILKSYWPIEQVRRCLPVFLVATSVPCFGSK